MHSIFLAICALAYTGASHAQPATGSTNPPKTWTTCAACHAAQGAAALGPSLNGVVGRKSGSVPGFAYSRAMRSASITWDERSLLDFLADPQKVVPGNRMPFAGVPDSSEAAELVHYLKTLR